MNSQANIKDSEKYDTHEIQENNIIRQCKLSATAALTLQL